MGFRASIILATLFIASNSLAVEATCDDAFKKGNFWSFLNFFSTPEAIKRAEKIYLSPSDLGRIEEYGRIRGKLIVGRPSGSAIEKFAYQIEKKIGYRVLLSDDWMSKPRVEGISRPHLPLSRNGKNEILNVIGLPENEAKTVGLSLVPVHETTHAWFDFLDGIGEGTPISISFVDLGRTNSGAYGYYLNAQELKTWSQDVVRVLRKNSESEILKRFQTAATLSQGYLFADIPKAIDKLTMLRKITSRAKIDLDEALIAMREGPESKMIVSDWLSEIFEKKSEGTIGLKKTFSVKLAASRKVNVPLNTKEDWKLALGMEASIDDPSAAEYARSALSANIIQKLERLANFNDDLILRLPDQIALMARIKSTPNFTRDEYAEVRRQLAAFGNLSTP